MDERAFFYAALRGLIDAREDLRQVLGDDWPAFARWIVLFLENLDREEDPFYYGMHWMLHTLEWSPARPVFEKIRDGVSDAEAAAPDAAMAPSGIDDLRALVDEAIGAFAPFGADSGSWDYPTTVPLLKSAPPPRAPPMPPLRELHQDIERGHVQLEETGSTPGEAPAETEREPELDRKPLRINAWIGDGPDAATEALPVGADATLCFQVGAPREASLIAGPEADIDRATIPDTGLDTEWVVSSREVTLAAVDAVTTLSERSLDGAYGPTTWTATFPLHIDRDGSIVRRLLITPFATGQPVLDVMIYVGRELYRQLVVRLRVEDPLAPAAGAGQPVCVEADVSHSPEAETGLRTTHEWTTPPEEFSIAVMGDRAFVHGSSGGESVAAPTPWYGTPASVAGPISNVRKAAESFRAAHEAYLNDIEPAFLEYALDPQQFTPVYDWTRPASADPAHMQAWEAVSRSPELFELASYGYLLYQAFFPDDGDLRGWLDDLWPGSRLDIFATRDTNPAWLPDVPWGLMVRTPPVPGEPVDPLQFLGLRYRLSYTIHAIADASKALGALDRTWRAHLLYWGGQPQDPTALEARRQAESWDRWPNQVFVPASEDTLGAKAALVKLLSSPDHTPTSVLYIFCQCSVGDGATPLLRFGSTNKPDDVVRQLELGLQPLADRPLVFANACTTAAADPYIANELAETFFRRRCRAFIGTETKVPIAFASRFASVFFSFFYREADPAHAPMAAGEAVSQARLFLWNRLANIGGLFYTYLNQYELFMADKDEVAALRAG